MAFNMHHISHSWEIKLVLHNPLTYTKHLVIQQKVQTSFVLTRPRNYFYYLTMKFFNLLGLPLELRCLIYFFFYESSTFNYPRMGSSLLCTNHQIRNEALAYYYRYATLFFLGSESFMDYMTALDPETISQLRRIRIHMVPLRLYLTSARTVSSEVGLADLLELFGGLQLDRLTLEETIVGDDNFDLFGNLLPDYSRLGHTVVGDDEYSMYVMPSRDSYREFERCAMGRGWKELTYVYRHEIGKMLDTFKPDMVNYAFTKLKDNFTRHSRINSGPRAGVFQRTTETLNVIEHRGDRPSGVTLPLGTIKFLVKRSPDAPYAVPPKELDPDESDSNKRTDGTSGIPHIS